jgi:hypothetical protein
MKNMKTPHSPLGMGTGSSFDYFMPFMVRDV